MKSPGKRTGFSTLSLTIWCFGGICQNIPVFLTESLNEVGGSCNAPLLAQTLHYYITLPAAKYWNCILAGGPDRMLNNWISPKKLSKRNEKVVFGRIQAALPQINLTAMHSTIFEIWLLIVIRISWPTNGAAELRTSRISNTKLMVRRILSKPLIQPSKRHPLVIAGSSGPMKFVFPLRKIGLDLIPSKKSKKTIRIQDSPKPVKKKKFIQAKSTSPQRCKFTKPYKNAPLKWLKDPAADLITDLLGSGKVRHFRNKTLVKMESSLPQ